MAVIFGFSSLRGDAVDSLGLSNETHHINGHFFLYFLLGLFLYRATRSYFLSILFGVFYGITDEVHQVFVPGRSSGFFDILVDSGGVIISLLWINLRLKIQKNSLKK